MQTVRQVVGLGGAMAFILAASSCAMIPAKLERAHALGLPNCPFEQESLYSLLELSLETPNEGDSAHALGHVVEKWREEWGDEVTGIVDPDTDSQSEIKFHVRFLASGPSMFLPAYFDELSPAVDYEVKKIEHYKKDGVGAPLRAFRENLGEEAIERHFPPEGISREITAVIHQRGKQGSVQNVEIELRCALYYEDVVLGGKRRPMAADYSVALAGVLERGKGLKRSEVADLLTPSPTRDPKLYLMELYDPAKEPLIMIHGLLDSPLAWGKLTNTLRSQSEFRKRYQIWHYLYNTSAPALYSGRILRTQYREMRHEFDPDSNDPASRKVTLLTHSMGGIVARSLITDPGEAFVKAAFTRPIESLVLSSEDRASLEEAFRWKPEPSVRRVIFIAVPHRGSDFTDNLIGKFGRVIVKPPNQFRAFYERVSEANPGAFTPAYEDLGKGRLDSVSALSPDQPTLQILPDLPLGHPVELYSIIGNRGKEGPLEESADGIVPYWSSHLDGVQSEKIVPSGHSALEDLETIEEVKRILRLP